MLIYVYLSYEIKVFMNFLKLLRLLLIKLKLNCTSIVLHCNKVATKVLIL